MFRGNIIPPPVISHGKSMLVIFTSQEGTIPQGYSGFFASYQTVTCPNDCSNHGICTLDQICDCNPGFTGIDCSITQCVDNCNNHGFCNIINSTKNESICICNLGWYGVGCHSDQCTGTHNFINSSGIIQNPSEYGEEAYYPNSNCTFIIQPPTNYTNDSISLFFVNFQTEPYYDVLTVYDGVNNAFLMNYSGSFLPFPIRTIPGHSKMIVTFVSNPQIQFLGFIAYYTLNSLCPNNCNNAGFCLKGICYCDGGKTGIDCSQTVNSTEVTINTTYVFELNSFQWKYFSFNISQQIGLFMINYEKISNRGNPLFYLAYERLPNFLNYDQMTYFFCWLSTWI
jgi:hypothetical protein